MHRKIRKTSLNIAPIQKIQTKNILLRNYFIKLICSFGWILLIFDIKIKLRNHNYAATIILKEEIYAVNFESHKQATT